MFRYRDDRSYIIIEQNNSNIDSMYYASKMLIFIRPVSRSPRRALSYDAV